MNLLLIIIGCLIANLIFTMALGYFCYRLYKKNEMKIDAIKDEVSLVINQVKSIDMEAIANQIKAIDIEQLTNSVNMIASSITSINEAITDIKAKLDNIKLPWG